MRKVLKLWSKRIDEYEASAATSRSMAAHLGAFDSLAARHYLLQANRYEGIVTATRWAIEDLKKFVEKTKAKANPRSSRVVRKSR